MAQAPLQLKWRGPTTQRAKPISAEKWQEHKEELCALYQTMTLDNLMSTMRDKHDFTPSPRQYVSQFQKWGVHKYKTANREAEPSVGPSSLGTSTSGLKTDTAHTEDTDLIPLLEVAAIQQKRTRSLLSEVVVSAEKRHKYDLVPTTEDYSYDPDETDWEMEDTGDSSFCSATTSSRSYDNELRERLYRSANESLSSFDDITSQYLEAGKEAPRTRQLDLNTPIQALSPEDLHCIKCAADLLLGASLHDEAFPLCVLLWKRSISTGQMSEPANYQNLITCIISARTQNALEIVQNSVESVLQESLADAEIFLLRMLLAYACYRCNVDSSGELHYRKAQALYFTNPNLLSTLPEQSRALDILTYICLVESERLFNRQYRPTPPLPALADPISAIVFKDQILERKPGPFEIEVGQMKNPCLRSCLNWCLHQLKDASSVALARPRQKIRESSNRRWVQVKVLYFVLYNQWHVGEVPCADPTLLVWMNESERRMGIPPSRLLETICWMIVENPKRKRRISNRNLGHRARQKALEISDFTDRRLATLFLEMEQHMLSVGPWPTEIKEFQRTALASLSYWIRKKLQILVPRVSGPTAQTLPSNMSASAATSTQNLVPRAASFVSALAISLHSSELSVRTLRDRIRRNNGRHSGDFTVTLPSTVFTQSQLSLTMSIDHLSLAMARSLNLS